MSSKLQTSSAIVFDKLVGDTYVDGTLTSCMGAQMTSPEYKTKSIITDLCNGVSLGTNGVYVTKGLFDEHKPYVLENNEDLTGKIIVFNYHFLKELRRQLSGEITFSQFSPAEQNLYDMYVKYLNGEDYNTNLQVMLDELDFWLTEEIQGHTHPTITRGYTDTHPWWKILTREIEEI